MKSKTSTITKKPSVAVRDLQAKKNPKGGGSVPVGGSLGTKAKTSPLTITGRSS